MIKFSINPFFFIIFFLAILHHFIYEILLLFAIVIIHELGHACTALSFGWRLKKIEILPFGGVVEVEEHGNKPLREEALVILAGPMMNLLMLGFAYLALTMGIWKEAFVYPFIEYNLIILLFNLLPIWPLDGGKLMQLILSIYFPYRKAIHHSLLMSGGCLFIYFVTVYSYFTFYFYLWIVALFLILSQWLEWRQSPYQYLRFLLERHQQYFSKQQTMDVTSIIVNPHQSIKDALSQMFRHKFHYFCVINHRGEIKNMIHEREMLDEYFTHKQGNCTVRDIFG